jgi:ribonuclease J
VNVDPRGHILEAPEILSQGFVYMPESADLMQTAESTIVNMIESNGFEDKSPEEMARRVKRRLEQFFYDETRRRPVVIPMINRISGTPYTEDTAEAIEIDEA